MKASKITVVLAAALLSFNICISCKEKQGDGMEVGAGVGNGEHYNNEQDKATGNQQEDHPGQNIGSHRDSTSTDGETGNPSNY